MQLDSYVLADELQTEPVVGVSLQSCGKSDGLAKEKSKSLHRLAAAVVLLLGSYVQQVAQLSQCSLQLGAVAESLLSLN